MTIIAPYKYLINCLSWSLHSLSFSWSLQNVVSHLDLLQCRTTLRIRRSNGAKNLDGIIICNHGQINFISTVLSKHYQINTNLQSMYTRRIALHLQAEICVSIHTRLHGIRNPALHNSAHFGQQVPRWQYIYQQDMVWSIQRASERTEYHGNGVFVSFALQDLHPSGSVLFMDSAVPAMDVSTHAQ